MLDNQMSNVKEAKAKQLVDQLEAFDGHPLVGKVFKDLDAVKVAMTEYTKSHGFTYVGNPNRGKTDPCNGAYFYCGNHSVYKDKVGESRQRNKKTSWNRLQLACICIVRKAYW